jgi:hypothetical protein
MKQIILSGLALFCSFQSGNVLAQPTLKLPETSQLAEVKQRIGYTDVTIVYHSPAVNDRKVWGGLVPYGKVWRAGANENTTITVTDDVKVENMPLPAGTYGLHMIPGENEWTVIFSRNSSSWGSYFYRKDEDALRVVVKPVGHEFTEWLDYTFKDRQAGSAVVALNWDKLQVPFKVSVDRHAIALRNMRDQLRGMPAFGWHGWEEAAHYCIVNKINYDEALTWINRSIAMEENFTNVAAKAQLLTLMGKTADAAESRTKMLKLLESANEAQVNAFGYELMGEKDLTGALAAFKLNVDKHPDSWNAYDSMAEASNAAGDKKASLGYYKKALSKAPADQKERIKNTITTLEKG